MPEEAHALKLHPDNPLPKPKHPRGAEGHPWGSEKFHEAIGKSGHRQKEFFEWYAQNPVRFLADAVKIAGKDKKLCPLDVRHPDYARAQVYFCEQFLDMLWTTGRVRLVVLKARQWGCTTLTNALLLWLMLFSEFAECVTVAEKQKKSVGILRMLHRMVKNLPKWIQPALQRSATHTIAFDGFNREWNYLKRRNDSQIQVDTANACDVGSSLTLSGLHGSEVSRWPDRAEEVLDAARNALADKGISICVLESTAYGVGGVFYDECMKALRQESEYRLVFIPWFAIDEYRLKPGDNRLLKTPGQWQDPVPLQALLDEKRYAEAGLDDTEKRLMESGEESMFGPIAAEQLLWRRWAIPNKCRNNPLTFRQEYPATPEEAFIGSGQPVFNPAPIRWQMINRCRPGQRGDFLREEVSNQIVWHPEENGCFEMFVPVVEGHEYILATDFAEGDVMPLSHQREPDKTAICIIDRHTREQVCRAKGRFMSYESAEMNLLAGQYYNWAILAPENNASYGTVTIEAAKTANYPNVYMTRVWDTLGQEVGRKFGWVTSVASRAQMFDTAQRAIHNKLFTLYSTDLCEELLSMIYVQRGNSGRIRPEAKPGAKDDEAMAFVIAVEVDRQLGILAKLEKINRKPHPDMNSPLYSKWLREQEEAGQFGVFEEYL